MRILEELLIRRQPIPHAELSHVLADVDRVTIYRNLSLLVDAGLVHSVQGIDGDWRYCVHQLDQAGCPGNHPHFICVECKTMICLKDQPIQRVEVPEGYSVQGKRLIVHGLCARCRKEEPPLSSRKENL